MPSSIEARIQQTPGAPTFLSTLSTVCLQTLVRSSLKPAYQGDFGRTQELRQAARVVRQPVDACNVLPSNHDQWRWTKHARQQGNGLCMWFGIGIDLSRFDSSAISLPHAHRYRTPRTAIPGLRLVGRSTRLSQTHPFTRLASGNGGRKPGTPSPRQGLCRSPPPLPGCSHYTSVQIPNAGRGERIRLATGRSLRIGRADSRSLYDHATVHPFSCDSLASSMIRSPSLAVSGLTNTSSRPRIAADTFS
jgi:hypothetical protein